MRKLGYAVAGLAFAGIALAITIPNFLNFRMKAARSPVEQSSTGYGGGTGRTTGEGMRQEYTTYTSPPSAPPQTSYDADNGKVQRQVRESGQAPLGQEYV